MSLFELWDLAPNMYCHKIAQKPEWFVVDRVISEIKTKFGDVFNPKFGCRTMTPVTLNMKSDRVPIFRPFSTPLLPL